MNTLAMKTLAMKNVAIKNVATIACADYASRGNLLGALLWPDRLS